MRLLGVELRRFGARRAIVVVLLGAALVTSLLLASTLWSTRPVSAADRAAAERQVARDTEGVREERRRCEANPKRYFGPGASARDCANSFDEPQLDWYLYRPELDLGEQTDETGLAVAACLVAVAILVGTTFAGADWGSGSMSNQLLFEARRLRLWSAKAAAVGIGLLVATALLLAVFWGVLAVVSAARDLDVSGADGRAVAWFSLRTAVLVVGVGLGCFALTMLLRATVGTLGLLFGFVVLSEVLVGTLPVARIARWSPLQNLGAWLRDGVQVYDERICGGYLRIEDGSCDPTYTLSLTHAAAYLGVLLLLAVGLSLWSFRTRDVP